MHHHSIIESIIPTSLVDKGSDSSLQWKMDLFIKTGNISTSNIGIINMEWHTRKVNKNQNSPVSLLKSICSSIGTKRYVYDSLLVSSECLCVHKQRDGILNRLGFPFYTATNSIRRSPDSKDISGVVHV